MPSAYQIAQISCTGGLDLRHNTQELLRKPGQAIRLENFEQNISGGYRRINGYQELKKKDALGGDIATPVPGIGPILGVYIYNEGYIVCRGDAVYFSFKDEIEWLQINKTSTTVNDEYIPADYSTFQGYTPIPRTGAGHYTFDEYTHGAGIVDLIIRDPSNQMAILTITGNDKATAKFTYRLITSGNIPKAGFGEIVKDQHVAAGNSEAPSEFYVSAITKIDDFTGTNSQRISVAEPIVGIKMFRQNLYIFCETSIWRAGSLDNPSQTLVQNVTRNVGCVDGSTIQEIGGDLIFLSHDGMRTLAGTDKIDDVNLSTVSLDIDGETLKIVENLNRFTLRSVALKERSQYRMFYSVPPEVSVNLIPERQEGIIATYYPNQQTGKMWSYSKTKGIEVSAINTGYHDELQVTIHGDFSGKVYLHDTGSSFDGRDVKAVYQTPYFDLGDSGVRKNFRELVLYTFPEGAVNLNCTVNYDYNNSNVTHQPLVYSFPLIRDAARYGTAKYGVDFEYRYGEITIPIRLMHIQGSGMTVSLTYETVGASDPFTIQGFDLNFTVAGRI